MPAFGGPGEPRGSAIRLVRRHAGAPVGISGQQPPSSGFSCRPFSVLLEEEQGCPCARDFAWPGPAETRLVLLLWEQGRRDAASRRAWLPLPSAPECGLRREASPRAVSHGPSPVDMHSGMQPGQANGLLGMARPLGPGWAGQQGLRSILPSHVLLNRFCPVEATGSQLRI